MPRRNLYTTSPSVGKKTLSLSSSTSDHKPDPTAYNDSDIIIIKKEQQQLIENSSISVVEHHHPLIVHHRENNDSDDIDDDTYDELNITTLQEIHIICKLSIQGLVSQLGWSVPSFLLASYIGRNYGPLYLDGYSLAMLTGNLCILSLLEGMFSAVTTLAPQAYGNKNYTELQYITIRAFLLCLIIVLCFMIILSIYIQDILLYVGEDPLAAQYAQDWFRIYCYSLPYYVLYHITNCFLAAQYIVMPEVITALISSILILPMLLIGFGSLYGYNGTSVAVVIYQLLQALFLLSYTKWKKPYHPETWTNKMDWHQVVRWKPFSNLLSLSGGAMLAGSEWIYWEILSLMVGTLGATQLTVHMISTQIITVTYMIPLGISEAIAIRLGNTLPQSSSRAKILCFWYIFSSIIIMSIVSSFVYIYRSSLYHIFTKDNDVIQGCEEIWLKVCLYIFTIGVMGIMEGIVTSLGRQYVLGMLVVILLWCISLPLLYYLAIRKNGGLNMAWQCVWPPNSLLITILAIYLTRIDWEVASAEARMHDDDHSDNGDDESVASEKERITIINKGEKYGTLYGSVISQETMSG